MNDYIDNNATLFFPVKQAKNFEGQDKMPSLNSQLYEQSRTKIKAQLRWLDQYRALS